MGRMSARTTRGMVLARQVNVKHSQQMYLDLLKRSLSNRLYDGAHWWKTDSQLWGSWLDLHFWEGQSHPAPRHLDLTHRELDVLQSFLWAHQRPGAWFQQGPGGLAGFLLGLISAMNVSRPLWVCSPEMEALQQQLRAYPFDVQELVFVQHPLPQAKIQAASQAVALVCLSESLDPHGLLWWQKQLPQGAVILSTVPQPSLPEAHLRPLHPSTSRLTGWQKHD